MKFNIIFSAKEDRFTRQIDGDLDTVKTYVKLTAGDKFTWGAIIRTDNLIPGDVEHWIIKKDYRNGGLLVSPFSFYKVHPEININAMRAALEQYPEMQEMNKLLGGGIL